jgi:hypothetical protein
MQHSRSKEAEKRWQDVTGKHDTIPDLGNLLRWLMDEIDRLEDTAVANAYMATGIKVDKTKYREQVKDFKAKIECRTKEAVWGRVHDYMIRHEKKWTYEGLRQAIDSAGEK